MKGELEIRQEINITLKLIQNKRNDYKKGKINLESLEKHLIDYESTIGSLKWVLNENDRYD